MSPNGFNNGIYFGDAADNDIGYINYAHGSDSMAFGVNAAERMYIDSSGAMIHKGAATLNEDGVNANFRIESDNDG